MTSRRALDLAFLLAASATAAGLVFRPLMPAFATLAARAVDGIDDADLVVRRTTAACL